jgi:hypothetical protein
MPPKKGHKRLLSAASHHKANAASHHKAKAASHHKAKAAPSRGSTKAPLSDKEYNVLQQLWKNPSVGLLNKNQLYDKIRDKIPNLTYSQLSKFVDAQPVSEIAKQVKASSLRQYYTTVTAKHVGNCVQIDLMDVSKFKSPKNKQISFLMCFIDVFSRYLIVKPLTNKKTSTIVHAFVECLKEFHHQVDNVTSDPGSEWISHEFKQTLKNYNIHQYTEDVGRHFKTGIVERVNRTIRSKISKYMIEYDTTTYIDALQHLVYNYNHTIHSTLGVTPFDMWNSHKHFISSQKIQRPSQLPVGTYVRVLQKKLKVGRQMFTYSPEIYKIDAIQGYGYRLRATETTNHLLPKTYYRHQLIPTQSKYSAPTLEKELDDIDETQKYNRQIKREGLD